MVAKRLDTAQRQKSLPSSLVIIYGFFNVNQLNFVSYFHHIQFALAVSAVDGNSSNSAAVTISSISHLYLVLESFISYLKTK